MDLKYVYNILSNICASYNKQKKATQADRFPLFFDLFFLEKFSKVPFSWKTFLRF